MGYVSYDRVGNNCIHPASDRVLAIIEDVSAEEKWAEQMLEQKLNTVKMAQSVIEKQMTTAQEIAGLLGETTAETKAILTSCVIRCWRARKGAGT